MGAEEAGQQKGGELALVPWLRLPRFMQPISALRGRGWGEGAVMTALGFGAPSPPNRAVTAMRTRDPLSKDP